MSSAAGQATAPMSAQGMLHAGGGGSSSGSSLQQMLALLSHSELQRATLLEELQGLKARMDDLRQQNSLLYSQVQQLYAEPGALDALASPELEELEGKLDSSIRAVRDALLMRKVDEAQRRSSTEQNQCTLCMEAARSVAFSCGHQSCEPCSSKLAACPFCRVTITAKIRLYDA